MLLRISCYLCIEELADKSGRVFNYLKGKLTNFRDEEVKEGFRWLKKESNYIDNISSASIKPNENFNFKEFKQNLFIKKLKNYVGK